MIRAHKSSVEPIVGAVVAAPGIRRLREIDGLVQSLVASWQSGGPLVERRCWHRVPFERLLGITPLEGDLPADQMRVAKGRDISLSGIAFTHTEPIPHRAVAITLWDDAGQTESIVTQLSWCRFTRSGEYQSGGKFLRIIDLPEPCPDDVDLLRRA